MSSESTVAIIFYSSLGIATLVTSVLIAFRFVKNCTSPLCSCNQDTNQSGGQQSGGSFTSSIMNAIPNIMTTVTSNESTGQKIAEVVGDVASALNTSVGDMGVHPHQQSNPMESGLLSAIPSIAKTVTSGESVGKTIAGVVDDLAISEKASTSIINMGDMGVYPHTEGLTSRVTTAVNNAMAVHTKAVTESLKRPASVDDSLLYETKKKYKVTPVAIMPDMHSAVASAATTDVASAV